LAGCRKRRGKAGTDTVAAAEQEPLSSGYLGRGYRRALPIELQEAIIPLFAPRRSTPFELHNRCDLCIRDERIECAPIELDELLFREPSLLSHRQQHISDQATPQLLHELMEGREVRGDTLVAAIERSKACHVALEAWIVQIIRDLVAHI